MLKETNPQGYGKPQTWVDRTGGPSLADLDPLRWHDDGECRELPPFLWFDEYAHHGTSPAVAICRTCPVQRTCLASALVFADEYGIYGGTTAGERMLLSRLRRGDTLGHVLDIALGATPGPAARSASSESSSRTLGAA